MRPLTFFWIGLLVGIGYLGSSFYIHLNLIEKTGKKVTKKLTELKKESSKRKPTQATTPAQQLVTTPQMTQPPQTSHPIKTEITDLLERVRSLESTFSNAQQNIQNMVTRLVKLGKQHHLTFLDYQKHGSKTLNQTSSVTTFSATLSLGGQFEHILNYLGALHERSLALPLMQVEVLATSEDNTMLRLKFSYPNNLPTLIEKYQSKLSETL